MLASHILGATLVRKTSLMLIVALVSSGLSTATAQSDGDRRADSSKRAARAGRARQMEGKLDALRKEFKQLGSRLKDVSDQAGANARAEWRMARRDLKQMEGDLQAEYEDGVAELSQALAEAWQTFEKGKAEAAEDIAATRAEWEAWTARLRSQYHASVEQLRVEINELDKQAQAAAKEEREKYIAARAQVRKQYEADVEEMQHAYQDYIDSLGAEMARIEKNIEKNVDQADGEMKAVLAEQSAEISAQMHAAYAELQSGYQDVAANATDYIESTQKWLADSDASVKRAARAELEAVARTARRVQAEMVAACQDQCDALEQEVASLESRAAKAQGDAKVKLHALADKLQTQHQAAVKRYEQAHDAYVADLNKHIDEMRADVANVGERSRQRMIEAIEARQAQLEQVKQDLKSRG